MSTGATVIGPYEVLRPLGSGGMGSVYLARDPRLDRLVAVKVLRDQASDESARDRFTREARSVARLDHANVIRIYEYGVDNGQPFIAMEYVEGETLAERIRSGPRTVAEVLSWMTQLCDGLAHAHASSVVHRDVKPANVLLARTGILKVVDFGIARLGNTTLTDSGALIGTLNYMAPEQIEGRPVDHRADIYAAGLVMYELLTGRQAFSGGLNEGILHAILTRTPVPIRSLCGNVPPAVAAIADRALQKAPQRRFPTMAAMVAELRRVGASVNEPAAMVADIAEAPTLAAHRHARGKPTTEVLRRAATAVVRNRRKAVGAVTLAVAAIAMAPKLRYPSTGAPAVTPPPVVEQRAPAPATPPAPPEPVSVSPPQSEPPRAEADPASAAAPAPTPSGELLIDATPWATVVRMTDASGGVVPESTNLTTPASLSLPAGAYAVTLRDQFGNTQTVRAQVRVGRRAEVTARFRTVAPADYLTGIAK
jgi:serine/threonine protein kinase